MRARIFRLLAVALLCVPLVAACSRAAKCADISLNPTTEPIPEYWRSLLELSPRSRACGDPTERVVDVLEASDATPAQRAVAVRERLKLKGWSVEGGAGDPGTRFEARRNAQVMKVEIREVEGRISPPTLALHFDVTGRSHNGPAF